MVIRPTKAEYKQYEELKKKIDEYEKSKTERIKMVEAVFKDVKDAILYDRDISIEFTPIVPTAISTSGLDYRSKIVIMVGV